MSKIYQNLSKKISLFSSILLCLFSINAFASGDSTYTSANYTNIISNNVQNADYSSGSSSTGTVSYKFKSVSPVIWSNGALHDNTAACFKSTWSVSQPSGSSAFIPTIKVQNTFMAFCLGYEATVTLHGYGQCAFLGLVRVCARNTPFCQYGNDIACDSESSGGNGIAGSTSPGTTGKSIPTDMCPNCLDSTNYRICAFEDPMFPGDATDIKANMMPFHQKTSVSPSVTGGDSLVALGLFITGIGLLVPGLGAGAIVVGCGLMAAGGIMELIEFITSKMNYVVIANHGCVEIPLTPSPPPYCPQIPTFSPIAKISSICQNSPDYKADSLAPGYNNYLTSKTVSTSPAFPSNTQISALDIPCEIAKQNNTALYSTFENPVIRLYFDNPIPVCTTGYDSIIDICIKTTISSSALNLWYKNYNLLPVCSNSVTTDCITFPSRSSYSYSFRPYYTIKNASTLGITSSNPSTPFAVLYPTPSSAGTASPYLSFAGINNSKYIDATPGNIVKITDYMGVQRSFLVYLESYGTQVCAAERFTTSTSTSLITTGTADVPVGCVARPTMLNPPVVTACNTSTDSCKYGSTNLTYPTCFTGAICPTANSVNLSTQPRLSLTIGATAQTGAIQTGVIAADSGIYNCSLCTGSSCPTCPPSSSSTAGPIYATPTAFCALDDITNRSNVTGTYTSNPAPCSLYGYQAFSAYLTDNKHLTADSISSSYTTPNYTTTSLSSAGAQYVNNQYCRGATNICLSGYSDPTKTVITKVVQSNDSSGNITKTPSNILSDRVIPAYSSSASSQTLSGTGTQGFFNPTSQYSLTASSNTRTAIGTLNKDLNIYYENLYCTSDPDNSCVANGTPAANAPVGTTCTCLDNTTTPATSSTCTISGCDKAFLTSTTSTPIEIGSNVIKIGSLSGGNYTEQSKCTTNSSYTCTTPTCLGSSCTSYQPTAQICTTTKSSLCKSGTYNSTTKSCTITGCEWSFVNPLLANSTTSLDTSNSNFYSNSSCTSSTEYSCGVPTSCNGVACTYPTTPTCTCSKNCTTNCVSGTYNAATGSCTIIGCEWAFQPAINNVASDSAYYSYNGVNYPIYGGTACTNGVTCYAQRPANALELGLCTPILQPSCPARSYSNNSSAGASTNGYANWPQTTLGSANVNVTGTCTAGSSYSNGKAPTRSCTYIDSGYEQITQVSDAGVTSTTNGCPIYTIGWGAVTNPCVATPLPWWPDQFLTNQSLFQGAIFNYFGINDAYQSKVTPLTQNSDAYKTAYNTYKSSSPPSSASSMIKQPWINSSTNYNSCENYSSSDIITTQTPRTYKDGDQEMLYLTSAQWQYLFNNNDFSWLYATENNLASGYSYSDYNGCKVYNLNGQINATVNSAVTVGMKICKYNTKVSFSLVDLKANTATDYTNNAYIMQSNIIAYEQLTTKNLGPSSLDKSNQDSTFDPNTTVINNVSTNDYLHYINHGIVVDTSGWTAPTTNVNPGAPPFASSVQTPESMNIDLTFIGYYHFNTTAGEYFKNTVNPQPYDNNGNAIYAEEHETLTEYTNRMLNNKLPVLTMPSSSECALSQYRNNINYNNSISDSTYFPTPTATPDDEASNNYLSKMYVQSVYDGGNKNGNGRVESNCGMRIKIRKYVAGNSAANTNMFLWSDSKNYKVCNF